MKVHQLPCCPAIHPSRSRVHAVVQLCHCFRRSIPAGPRTSRVEYHVSHKKSVAGAHSLGSQQSRPRGPTTPWRSPGVRLPTGRPPRPAPQPQPAQDCDTWFLTPSRGASSRTACCQATWGTSPWTPGFGRGGDRSARCAGWTLWTRDVPGKEREKTGTGKKRERNAFFPFPFLHFWAPVFFPFLAKIMKNGWKTRRNGQKTAGKMWNGQERPFHAVPNCRIWRDSVFLPFKTRFGPRSNPFFTPFQPVFYPVFFPFLPLSFPVLVPFLYCLAIISRCAPVATQPLDHVGPSLVRGTSGRFIFVVRKC